MQYIRSPQGPSLAPTQRDGGPRISLISAECTLTRGTKPELIDEWELYHRPLSGGAERRVKRNMMPFESRRKPTGKRFFKTHQKSCKALVSYGPMETPRFVTEPPLLRPATS